MAKEHDSFIAEEIRRIAHEPMKLRPNALFLYGAARVRMLHESGMLDDLLSSGMTIMCDIGAREEIRRLRPGARS